MSRLLRVLLFPASLLLLLSPSLAQPPAGPGLASPRLEIILPYGAKAGTDVELTFTGTETEGVTQLLFSHPGIRAELIPPPEPKVDPKADPKKDKAPPAMAKTPPPGPAKFKVTVAADVPPGHYEVRLVNPAGLSNSRFFTVGDLPEVVEKEPNNDVAEAQKIEINSTVNGSFAAGTDVDFYAFAGKKGQRVLASCLTSSIDSKAQPLIEFFEASGRPLTSGRNYQGNDALADVTIPADGDYLVRVTQFTYLAGGPQFFYRLTLSTNPWIDAVYPSVIEAGKPTPVTLWGRNLPGGTPDPTVRLQGVILDKVTATITPPNDPQAPFKLGYRGQIDPKQAFRDGFEYRLKGPGGSSNPVLIGITTTPVVLEKEPNDTPETAQEVATNTDIIGTIGKAFDRDCFTFPATKGEVLHFDLWSDRQGSNSFLFATMINPVDKKPIAEMTDEAQDNTPFPQFPLRNNDPTPLKFTAPADGKFVIRVASRESNFNYGPRISYRLRISKGNPDFRLIMMTPSTSRTESTILRGDGNDYLNVLVQRTDDFRGPITLSAEGLPAGVTFAPGQIISAGAKFGVLVLNVSDKATPALGSIVVKGTATINGQPVTREARPAAVVWTSAQPDQVTPLVARVTQDFPVAVREKAFFRVAAEPENAFIKAGEKLPQPLFIKQGEKVTVPFKVIRSAAESKVPINLALIAVGNPANLPFTVANPPAVAPDKGEGTFVIDVKPTALPGPYTAVLRATAAVQIDDPAKKGKKPATISVPTNPVTFTVLPLTVGKVTVTGPAGNLKVGMTGELTVKIERQFEYAGDFKLKIVLPMGAKGLTADEVTIPAGKDEAKVVLKVAPDAAAGAIQNIALQAVGTVEAKIAITQEAKFNVNIEKAPVPTPPKK